MKPDQALARYAQLKYGDPNPGGVLFQNDPDAETLAAIRSEVAMWQAKFDAEALAEVFPEPVNLLRRFAAPALEETDVPEQLGAYPSVWAAAGGFDPSMAMMAALVSAAAMLDDRFRLEVSRASGWYESARLWSLTVAMPGTGKTPSQKAMLGPVYAAHEAERTAWGAIAATAPEDDSPPQPRVFVSDVTVEKLTEVLVENPGGVLFQNDEFAALVGGFDTYRGGGGRDGAEWCRLFDGGPHQIERVQRGTVYVPNWSCSVLSATTPDALARIAKRLGTDGLLQRFLTLSAGPRRPPVSGVDPEADRRAYAELLARLRSYRPTENRVVQFAPEAREAFAAWEQRQPAAVEAAYSILPAFGCHVAKHPAMCARLALVFHAATQPGRPDAAPVPAWAVERAIGLLAKARTHAFTVYADVLGDSGPLALARDVARWLLARRRDVIERRDVVQHVRPFRQAEAGERNQAMQLLEDYGWVLADGSRYDKGHATRWNVNPKVGELFAEEAEREKSRRLAAVELLHERTEGRRDE